MSEPTRATFLHPKVCRVASVDATATSGRTFSTVVNQALPGQMLREDAIDTEAFEKRPGRPSLPFEDVLASLKRDGPL